MLIKNIFLKVRKSKNFFKRNKKSYSVIWVHFKLSLWVQRLPTLEPGAFNLRQTYKRLATLRQFEMHPVISYDKEGLAAYSVHNSSIVLPVSVFQKAGVYFLFRISASNFFTKSFSYFFSIHCKKRAVTRYASV